MVKQVKAIPKINVEKMETVLDLSVAVQHLCVTMQASGMNDHLNNPLLLQELVEKLPGAQKLEWATFKLAQEVVNLSNFAEWLNEVAEKAVSVMSWNSSLSKSTEEKTECHKKKQDNFHSFHSENLKSTNTESNSKCCICNTENHIVAHCPVFKQKIVSDRWTAIKSHNLCRKCLVKHNWKYCKSRLNCGVNGCQFKHHALLHDSEKHTIITSQPCQTNSSTEVSATHSTFPVKIMFRVVPVTLHGPKKKLKTFAFLDEGSSKTLIDDRIAKALDIHGPNVPLNLKWTGDIKRQEKNSRKVSLSISGADGKQYPMINVHTVDKLDLIVQSQEINSKETHYEHLRNLPFSCYNNAKPSILIGMEHWQLAIPLELREGNWGEPGATRTRLGWVVHGVHSNELESNLHCFHGTDTDDAYDQLHNMVKEFYSIESFGVKVPQQMLVSRDDARANAILEQTVKKVDGRYEAGLLWRNEREKKAIQWLCKGSSVWKRECKKIRNCAKILNARSMITFAKVMLRNCLWKKLIKQHQNCGISQYFQF